MTLCVNHFLAREATGRQSRSSTSPPELVGPDFSRAKEPRPVFPSGELSLGLTSRSALHEAKSPAHFCEPPSSFVPVFDLFCAAGSCSPSSLYVCEWSFPASEQECATSIFMEGVQFSVARIQFSVPAASVFGSSAALCANLILLLG
jgi:hypothetical protein